MKNVLIALDYDPTAQKIAETGFSLAQNIGAKVTLLHVLADPLYYSTSAVYFPMMGFSGYLDIDLQLDVINELKKASKHFLDKSKQHLGDETIETLVVEGDFAQSILDTANNLKVDIIVMGSHGKRWLEQILMGSVTEKVLHHTVVPLFVIPTKKK